MVVRELQEALAKADPEMQVIASVGSPLGSEECEVMEAFVHHDTTGPKKFILLILQEFEEEA